MASNYTEHYGLCQWETTDQVLRTEFNEDYQKIDRALKALVDKTLALEALISQCGNCGVYTTSYVGTGASGQSSPNTLTFSAPVFFVLVSGGEMNAWGSVANKTSFSIRGGHMMMPASSGNSASPTTWSPDGKTISWYNQNSNALEQMNAAGVQYTVFALLISEI